MDNLENVDLLDHVDLTWNNHNSHLCSSVKNWRHSDEFKDVTLVYENTKVQAHKIVLAAFSPFFKRILLDNPHPHPLVYLRGVTKREMDGVLDFMYFGKVEVAVKDIDPLMKIFSEFEVVDCDGFENVDTGGTQNQESSLDQHLDLPPSDTASESPVSKGVISSGINFNKKKNVPVIQESSPDTRMESPPHSASVAPSKKLNKRRNGENLSPNKKVKSENVDCPSFDPSGSVSPTTWISENTLDDMLIKSEPITSLEEKEFQDKHISDVKHITQDEYHLGMFGVDENDYIGKGENDYIGESENDYNYIGEGYKEWRSLCEIDPDCSQAECFIMMAECPTRYKCTECCYESKGKTIVINHIEAKHLHGTYPCDHCEKVFTNKQSLKQHVKMKHYEEYYNLMMLKKSQKFNKTP